MRIRTTAAISALCIAFCTVGVAQADEVPPPFQNRPDARRCDNSVPTIVGAGVIVDGPGPDVIFGSAGPDTISGMGGNDVILGLGDNDTVFGGGGDDLICLGWGNDQAQGWRGRRHRLRRARRRRHARRRRDGPVVRLRLLPAVHGCPGQLPTDCRNRISVVGSGLTPSCRNESSTRARARTVLCGFRARNEAASASR